MANASITQALTRLFLAFPQNGDENERTAKLAVYCEILASVEARFVIEACQCAAKGKLGAFLPPAGELYQLAEKLAATSIARKHESRGADDPNSGYFARYNDPGDILYRGDPTATWTTATK
jgi:hypothetical protein